MYKLGKFLGVDKKTMTNMIEEIDTNKDGFICLNEWTN